MSFGIPYLGTPNGILQILHLVFGAVSLVLISTSYVKNLTLDIFVGTVAVCFILSFVYLIVHMTIVGIYNNRANRIVSCIYHVTAGTFLIAAGIDLIGWSAYDINCGFKCPNIYNIGVAKILTFINGTLYGIHGFLEIKDDDSDDEDFYGESLPLIRITSPVERTKIKSDFEPQAHCSKNMHIVHTTSNISAINA